MSELSTIGTAATLIGLGSAVIWLGWRVGADGVAAQAVRHAHGGVR
jgi:hypothetical protein